MLQTRSPKQFLNRERAEDSHVKPGYYYYKLVDVVEERNRAGDSIRGLVALAEKYEIQMGYHNHTNYIGAPIWDMAPVMDSIDSRWCGYYFDLGQLRWIYGRERLEDGEPSRCSRD